MVIGRDPNAPSASGIGIRSTATIRPGESTENQRNVVLELDDSDKIIIEDCISRKLSAETAFLTVTDTRLNNGKPRITKPAVEKYYSDLTKHGPKYPPCPITGLDAKLMLSIYLYDSPEHKNVVGKLMVPLEENIIKKVSTSVLVEAVDTMPMEKRRTKLGSPLMMESFVGKNNP